MHPACLEKRFVVFGERFELSRHMVNEHGEEWKLSKLQKKQALTIEPNFQVGTCAAVHTAAGRLVADAR